MRRQILLSRLILLLLSCIYLFGCKKDNATADPRTDLQPAITPIGTPVGSPVSKSIGNAGGSLISPDGRFKITIPSGALNSNTNITIQPVTNEAPGGIGLAYDLLPNGTTFSKPITLTFNYTNAEVPDNIPYFLFIAYQDSARAWKADARQRDFDTVAKTVSLDVDHFTIFTFVDMMPIQAGTTMFILRESEKTDVWVIESVLDNKGRISETRFVPEEFIQGWKVNISPNGNSFEGTITGSRKNPVTYTAPSSIDYKRTVRVSVDLKVTETIYDKG